MIRCVRCNTELADTARFCASCGAAVEAAPLAAPVSPFEATALPGSTVDPYGTTQRPDISSAKSEPPPPMPVSPLAASAALSNRNAYQELVEAEKKKKETPAPDAKKQLAGTQMMAGAPVRPSPPTPSPAPAPAKKPVPRTVAMGDWTPPKPASVPPAAAPSNAVPSPAPSSPRSPPRERGPQVPASAISPSVHAAPSAQAPSGPGGWGWNAPSRGYAFTPGAHVQVTWSNGQRYPAVVVQVSGAQCLVVFPDGQQHWVETHFLSGG